MKRARGGNFTGLEVAHIFPLMAVGNRNWTNLMSESAREKVATRRAADSPHNDILLRADVHSLFDDYQCGVYGLSQSRACAELFVSRSLVPQLWKNAKPF